MKTTDAEKRIGSLTAFFKDELMPIAEKAKSEKGDIFSTSRGPWLTSYYEERSLKTMQPKDFENGGVDAIKSLDDRLTKFWEQHGDEDMALLMPTLVKLADFLYGVEKQERDVSPFIYTMY